MWFCVLLADTAGNASEFNDLTVVAASEPVAAVDAVERAGAQFVLIGAPRALQGASETTASLLSGRFPDVRVASIVTEHAPIALLCAMIVARGITTEPARGVALVRAILANSWSGAWARSVAKLAQPTPRLGQHLRSLLPGEGFLVRNQPSPAVLSRFGPDDVPATGMDRVLLAQDNGVPAVLSRQLADLPGVTGVRHVALPGSWSSVYGTDRVGQVALAPADPKLILPPVGHECPACGLPQAESVCPFCHVVVQPEIVPVAVRRPA